MTKLNLGCGSQKISGFVGVDLCPEAELHHDLRNPLPFEDSSVEEILAIHVIESFYQWEFPAVLADWYRVLQPEGKITIEFTSLTDTIKMYLGDDKQHGHWGLFGNQEKPIDPIVLHHYVYEIDELKELAEKVGFVDIEFSSKDMNHVNNRDWRMYASKK
jgi:predicted SAM-dependent methyltransferase